MWGNWWKSAGLEVIWERLCVGTAGSGWKVRTFRGCGDVRKGGCGVGAGWCFCGDAGSGAGIQRGQLAVERLRVLWGWISGDWCGNGGRELGKCGMVGGVRNPGTVGPIRRGGSGVRGIEWDRKAAGFGGMGRSAGDWGRVKYPGRKLRQDVLENVGARGIGPARDLMGAEAELARMGSRNSVGTGMGVRRLGRDGPERSCEGAMERFRGESAGGGCLRFGAVLELGGVGMGLYKGGKGAIFLRLFWWAGRCRVNWWGKSAREWGKRVAFGDKSGNYGIVMAK